VQILQRRLPGSTTRAIALLALFVAVQFADGVMTYVGITRFGPSAEGNPLLAFLMSTYGAAPVLIDSKIAAVACGVVLFSRTWHRTLAGLTIAYVFGALAPWAWMIG